MLQPLCCSGPYSGIWKPLDFGSDSASKKGTYYLFQRTCQLSWVLPRSSTTDGGPWLWDFYSDHKRGRQRGKVYSYQLSLECHPYIMKTIIITDSVIQKFCHLNPQIYIDYFWVHQTSKLEKYLATDWLSGIPRVTASTLPSRRVKPF